MHSGHGRAIAKTSVGVGVVMAGGTVLSCWSLLRLLRSIFESVGIAPPTKAQLVASEATWKSHALFRHFPGLRKVIAWRAYGDFPTPVHRGTMTSSRNQKEVTFAVKREDLASGSYGGNKVRTLQHSLAVCEARSPSKVVVMGSGGSNQVVATMVHSRQARLPVQALWVTPDKADLDNTLNMLSGLSLSAGEHLTWGTPMRCLYNFMAALWYTTRSLYVACAHTPTHPSLSAGIRLLSYWRLVVSLRQASSAKSPAHWSWRVRSRTG